MGKIAKTTRGNGAEYQIIEPDLEYVIKYLETIKEPDLDALEYTDAIKKPVDAIKQLETIKEPVNAIKYLEVIEKSDLDYATMCIEAIKEAEEKYIQKHKHLEENITTTRLKKADDLIKERLNIKPKESET